MSNSRVRNILMGGATKSHCKGVNTGKGKSVIIFEVYDDYGKSIIASDGMRVLETILDWYESGNCRCED